MRTNRRRLLSLSGALLGSALLGGCVGGNADGGGSINAPRADGGTVDAGQELTADVARDENPDVSGATLRELTRANADFGLDLLEALGADSSENLLLSPYSVGVALAMTWAGARGETETQMAETLGFTLGQDGQHAAFDALDLELEARAGEPQNDGDDGDDDSLPFRLETANAIWGLPDYPWSDAFLATLATNYGAGLRTLDFVEDPEGSRRTINAWVEDQTRDKIQDLIPQGVIDPTTRLVLTNAVYFLAEWAKTFEKGMTSNEPFTALDGTESRVPMMRQVESFPYAEVDGTQVLELPYEDGDIAMTLLLPPEGEFDSFMGSLDADRLGSMVDAMETRGVDVSIPKFSYESAFSLKDALSTLGMKVAFEGEADFSGMVESDSADLYIKDVMHKTYIDVDEKGTEAAAATAVVVAETAGHMAQVEFVADRPFLYLIRDRETGAVLFVGRVVDAGAAQ